MSPVQPRIQPAPGQSMNAELEVGNDLSLSVNILNFNIPLSEVTWSHSGNLLTPGVDRVSITTDSSLMFPPVMSTLRRTSIQPLDFGVYVVTAISPVGNVSFTFNVLLQGKFS